MLNGLFGASSTAVDDELTEGLALLLKYEAEGTIKKKGPQSADQKRANELAGILADSGTEREGALRRYGRHTGMAFQLVDDLLDLTGDDQTLGKPAASDLREGKATLPVLDLLSAGDPEDAALIGRVVECAPDADAAIEVLRERLRVTGSLERSRTMARQYARAAIDELDAFEPGRARTALATLPELLVFRDR